MFSRGNGKTSSFYYICIHDIGPRVDRKGKKKRTKQGISKYRKRKDTKGIRKKPCGISTITGVL